MLTERQRQILDFIVERIREGASPTVREIMARFGFSSPNAVNTHLILLEKKGVIRREPNRSRNIMLAGSHDEVRTFGHEGSGPSSGGFVKEAPGEYGSLGNPLGSSLRGLLRIPLLGAIPAGMPSNTMGDEEREDRCISVDPDTLELPRNARTFALEVRGDSMINAGILDRDVVIMELVGEPRNGDIVAALIDGETTLKRYVLRGKKPNQQPFLKAENENYPEIIPARELVIQGVFRALIRINRARS